jgi:hypothetical protein
MRSVGAPALPFAAATDSILIGDSDPYFVRDIYLSLKEIVILLEGHMLAVLECVECFLELEERIDKPLTFLKSVGQAVS